jgi:hypothetical protein
MKVTKKMVKEEVKKGVKGHQKKVDKEIDKLEDDVDKDIKKLENDKLLYLLSNTKQKGLFFHNKFKDHTGTAIIAAFSFLIALSWKDLIVKIVNDNLKKGILESHPYLSDLITAFVVTIFSVIAIIFVSKWAGKEK